MVWHPKHCSVPALLLVISLFSGTAVAQSIAIHLGGTNQTSIEASASMNLGYRIQASADAENWEDISDQAAGSWSFRTDATTDQKRFFRLRTWPTEDVPITVVLIGDSTVAEFASNFERHYGWGPGLPGYLKPNVTVVNLAVPYQSSKTFLSSSQKDSLLAIKPDFVIVQLGLVDIWDIEGSMTFIPEYEANFRTIIQMIRDFKGTPILVTPPVWRQFDAQGRVFPWLEDRCAVLKKLAVELQTSIVDLNQATKELFNRLGPIDSEYISQQDGAHFSLVGSKIIAGLVVEQLPAILKAQVLTNPPPVQ